MSKGGTAKKKPKLSKTEGWRAALEEKFSSGLTEIPFGPDGFEYKAMVEHLESAIEQIHSEKSAYIEKWQIVMEIMDRIYREFTIFDDRPSTVVTFKDHFAEKKVKLFAQKLTKYFGSLPRTYNLIVQVPQLTEADCTNFRLTSRISAVESFEKPVQLRMSDLSGSKQSLWQALENRRLAEDRAKNEKAGAGFYVKTSLTGYGSTSFENVAVNSAIARAKQVLFFLIIEEIVDVGTHGSSGDRARAKVFIQDPLEEDAEPKEIHIPESLAAFLSRIKLHSKRKAKIEKDRSEYKNSKGKTLTLLTTPSEPQPFLSLDAKCQRIVDFDSDNHNAISFKNALVWGFDSLMNEFDPLTSFIQLSIALEAVLGVDTDRTDKTKQLADRCALLLGNNRQRRQELRQEFIKFYNVRSDLVHGSKTSFDSSVSHMRSWGEWALRSVLRKELWFTNFDPPGR